MRSTLPLLAVGAMVLGTVFLGIARRHLAAVLETWRRDSSSRSD